MTAENTAQTLKSAFGLIRAVLPVLYCGGLLYYFLDFGSWQNIMDMGLGPTVLGLGLVGLLFCIPLVLKIVRIFARPRSPGSGPDKPDDENGFDADAAIARYLAQRSAETGPSPSPAPRAQQTRGAVKRASFGRKTG